MVKEMKTVLTIAGSDSSGGAGIQADIKAMTVNGVYAMSVITALTAQNTVGVKAILEVPPEFLCKQLDAVFEDIFPDSIKIGMIPSAEHICTVAERLQHYKAKNIVVDPVMVSTSGTSLIKSDAIKTLEEVLLPMATVITPNIPEAQALTNMVIENREDMIKSAKFMAKAYRVAVLLKGGHLEEDADDLLVADEKCIWIKGKRILNPNTHGTGCTLSSAIATYLAKGYSLEEAIRLAKEYVQGAISAMLDLGKGRGPIMHNFRI